MTQLATTRFGPAGFPEQAKGKLERVFEVLKEAKLSALEYAAVYGLRVSEEKAKRMGDLARSANINMSMHAAYYISLMSKEPATRERSKGRLVKALKFAPLMGVKRIVFHAGGYSGTSGEEAYQIVRAALAEVWETAGHLGGGALLAIETSGKHSAFGSVDEIIRVSAELDGVIPTIDWAHEYAKSGGSIDTREGYLEILEKFEKGLGSEFTKNMHFHASGITFTDKGEKSHKPLGMDWGPNLHPLMELVSELGYKPTFISESTNPIEGALYMKFLLEEIEKAKK